MAATAPLQFPKPRVDADRRREERFGAEGDVTLFVFDGQRELEYSAKLLDFSLHGLRIRLSRELKNGQEVRVVFSWGEATTNVMWTARLANAFESGLQLF